MLPNFLPEIKKAIISGSNGTEKEPEKNTTNEDKEKKNDKKN